MTLSQRCQYAVRAVYELARRGKDGWATIGEIAAAQAIPQRFLEGILGQLRQAKFVESRRGPQGGYVLARPANKLSVGEVIRFMEGEFEPVKCVAGPDKSECPLRGACPFKGLWDRAARAVEGVFDSATFADLVAEQAESCGKGGDYAI